MVELYVYLFMRALVCPAHCSGVDAASRYSPKPVHFPSFVLEDHPLNYRQQQSFEADINVAAIGWSNSHINVILSTFCRFEHRQQCAAFDEVSIALKNTGGGRL